MHLIGTGSLRYALLRRDAASRPRVRFASAGFVLWSVWLALWPAVATAAPTTLDDFSTLDAWTVTASDGVTARIASADGPQGKCLRLDFDFRSGAGFCVVRRDIALELPDNYRFTFQVRGEAPRNNLEFKLIDPSGDNVWWVNRRDYAFPKDWTQVAYKARHFRFAWGPLGGARLDRIGAIEFAIAASSGGAGSVYIDALTYETLPAPQPPSTAPGLRFSSNAAPDRELKPNGRIEWTSAPDDALPWVELDFGAVRELGGVVIEWADAAHPRDYRVELSFDGNTWETGASVRASNGGRDYVALPDAEAARLRISAAGAQDGPIGVRNLSVRDVAFSESPNRFFAAIAGESPPGRFPEYFSAKQVPWTVVGVADDEKEALVSAHGAVEVDRGAWSIEPFLQVSGRMVTWADARIAQSLADGYVPIPTVTWRFADIQLDATFFASGDAGASQLVARYEVRNLGDAPQTGALELAIRPFQVLPPWQELNMTGGVSAISEIQFDDGVVTVDGGRTVVPIPLPDAFGAAAFAHGDITEYLADHALPAAQSVKDDTGWASAGLRFAFDLAPGEVYHAALVVPFHERTPKAAGTSLKKEQLDALQTAVRDAWRRELSRVTLDLPQSAQAVEDTFRATQAYILINGDGPSIQPGSRTYERSWIRDGAITSTALLATGHVEKVRAFLDWYAGHQYPSGKVPCVVDRRGPDPVPEHDSSGELIYALHTYFRHTRDREFLDAHLEYVVKAVDYLEALRNERTGERYREGSPIDRACYGLVPESISHEGYSAKPMHSYWDNFFTVKGFADAEAIARALDRSDVAQRCAALLKAHHAALYRSLELAMRHHEIDYLPGCVELGDFDATSTAIGVFPCDQLASLPRGPLDRTFDRYYEFFEQRRDGALAWENYTPYELRIVGTFVRLEAPDRARALLDFFMRDQTPTGWRQWAEVVWRDHASPRFIGDMPHTWVGSAFLNAVRSMLVYEREGQLVLLAGVGEDWLAEGEGVGIDGFPTYFGKIGLRARLHDRTLDVSVSGDAQPPDGLRLRLPLPGIPQRVLVDGQPVDVPAGREMALPAGAGRVEVSWP